MTNYRNVKIIILIPKDFDTKIIRPYFRTYAMLLNCSKYYTTIVRGICSASFPDTERNSIDGVI